MKMMHCTTIFLCFSLTGCNFFKNNHSENTNQMCEIVPPNSVATSEEKSKRNAAQVELSLLGNSSTVNENDFKKTVNKTYQTVDDKDAACAMLLKTITCLNNNGVSKENLREFQNYLAETKSCERNEEANISIDSIMQLTQKGYGHRKMPLVLDLLLRNSGDKPATVSNVELRFDEKQRSSRSPADILKVSGVYVVTVSGNGSTTSIESKSDRTVDNSGFTAPANAYYPGPGVNSLIIDSPLSQYLPPRTVDRFRIQIDFLEDADIRGNMETVSAKIIYNDNKNVTSKMLELVK